MPGTYTVNVGAFEGPFDLLLQLIARRKVDIYEVSIAEITDDYLVVLRTMEQVDLEVTTEFLVVAATLLELKAARLLPDEQDPELEEVALEARDLLYARLLDYRLFKQAAAHIDAQLEGSSGFHPRVVASTDLPAVRPVAELGIDVEAFARLAARVFADRPDASVDVSHLQPVRMSVADAADLVVSELRRAAGRVSFREITAGCRHPVEVAVCFLAVLELYKHEHVDLEQASNFGELIVSSPDPTRQDTGVLGAHEGSQRDTGTAAGEPA